MLEPLLDVHEVGIEGALVTRVDHPYDETELEEAVYVATMAREKTRNQGWNKCTYAVILMAINERASSILLTAD